MIGDSLMGDDSLIQRYHADPERPIHPWAPWKDAEGRSTYDRVAGELALLPRSSRILDLACGDGRLLALLAEMGFSNLAGVDLSSDELGRAREALGPGPALHQGDARALPLPSLSCEAVTCHMALMLMEPVEPVLAEVARVLTPGGLFVALVNDYRVDPAYEAYRREVHRITREMGHDRLRLGDPRVFSSDGLRALIGEHPFDAGSVAIHDFEVRTRGTPRDLWSRLRWMYDVYRLPPEARTRLEARLTRRWQPLAEQGGALTCALGMRLVTCRKASGSP